MKKLVTICIILILAGAIGYLVFGQLEKSAVYFVTNSELLAKGEAAINQPVRLGGMVKKGSILWEGNKTKVSFILTDGKKEIMIHSQKTPPQMFQENMGVVLEGQLLNDSTFEASNVMVKHSNEYHPPKAGEKPAIIYKELVQ